MKSNIDPAAHGLGGIPVHHCTSDSPQPYTPLTRQSEREMRTAYRWAVVRGIKIFYREVGDPAKPTILLLHGFPSSSHMYRELMDLLAGDFHLVAPDYPGSGFSDYPPVDRFMPSFANLADLMSEFTRQIGLTHFLLYMQDFGGPVGLRMATEQPEQINGLIVQNANAYVEGIAADQLTAIMAAQRQGAEQLVSRDFALQLYKTGARDFEAMDPTSWNVDAWVLDHAEARRIQTELMLDYRSNVAEYPRWHAYLRRNTPKTLIVWGRNDPVFLPSGAQAYLRDLPEAKLRFYDTGHFALEEDAPAIASEILAFFGRSERGFCS
ncbi:alpha/beta hydrolase [uncultured Ramlibacter sp.]|uniref:alpha/beta fold hydrolase n=1 Tax=uncultured Ramlibacter sp. TaxID=260755 RepID=UPI002630304C|nr:alpha/beta hydrolase [uncultured Ramlibacter sp.]